MELNFYRDKEFTRWGSQSIYRGKNRETAPAIEELNFTGGVRILIYRILEDTREDCMSRC